VIRVALYARYSSDRQNERSISDQLSLLIQHAGAKGWAVVGTYTDAAISGSAMANRPGLLAALAAAERGEFDLLLAEDEDRLARNLEHLAHVANRLADIGAGIATLSTDRVQDMHVAFKGLIAQDFIRNLSMKTKRGMASNAEKGLATGSRLYGYRSQPGGAVEIVPDQAEVVRRIFSMYVNDRMSSREIAERLNRDRIPSPAGREWNASSIQGSRQRANGILHSEIYAGVKVYNRVEMRKDRQTGRKITICKPPSEHKRIDVPHLAIIDQDLWNAARQRLDSRQTADPSQRASLRRRPGLLSGLTKCGCCGASYTSLSQGRLVCAAYREKGVSACNNNRHVKRAEIEQRVLDGLRTRLLAPEAIAAYVRAYHAAWAEQAAQVEDRRRPLTRRLAEVERAIERGAEALLSGATAAAVIGKKLEALEIEQAQLKATLEQLDAEGAPPVQLHPRAAENYARKIEQLQARLAEAAGSTDDADRDLIGSVRGLIQKVDIEPINKSRGSPVRVTLHGDLARFVLPQHPPASGCALVVGGGIEPPTCGL